ncbi:MAG: Ig-like domain-containing protein [Lachnospiraceae bacterium]
MTDIKKRIVSMILALCMIFTMVPVSHVSAAEPKYYTVEKYDSEGNGTMLVKPTVSTSWSGRYGTDFITSLVGGSDHIRMSNDEVTGFPDADQEDGWLDNGDLGDGSRWIIAITGGNCYVDSSYFYASEATVLRFIYVPGGDMDKAGLSSTGTNWGSDGSVKVNKDDLIVEASGYDPENLGGNRLKAYNEAIAMILNTKDATDDSVAEALQNLQNARDFAAGISILEESAELYAGQKQELTAVLEPLGSTDKLTWTSSDDSVVAVEDGVLKGMSAGTATVTVTAENPEVKDSIEVTVKALQALYITNMGSGDTIMAETEELNLMADVEPGGIENLDWQWSVEDDSVAEVIPMEGNEYLASVKGKKEGTTRIFVSLGSQKAEFEVHVTPYEGPYVYFEYTDGREPQLLDENDTITLTCLDEGKFVVGNSNGTTVWSGGSDYVTSLAGGDDLQYWVFVNKEIGEWNPWDVRTLNLTVDSGGWSKDFKLDCVPSGITELKNYVNGTEVTLDDPYVTEGKISGVGVATKGKNADGEWIDIPVQALHYTTSDTTYNFRWVGNQMSITSGGQATMSVFMRDDWNVKAQFLAKCTYVQLEGFTIETPETFTITGEKDFMTGYYYGLQLYSDNLKITYTPSNATNTELIWESLTPDIAFFTTQHNSGIVPLKCGTARFKVTSQDNPSLTQDVTVTFLYLYPLESAELAQTEYEMKVGDTQALEITVTPSNATEKGFSYSYDREGIVEVKDGTIIAKSAGEVTVTGTPLDDTMGCNAITFTVKVTGEAVEQDDPTAIVADGIAHGLSYLESRSVSEYGDEWNIFTILRAGGYVSEDNQAAYLNSVEARLTADASENKLQPTDYVRMVLTLGVMGEDPEDFRGFNLVEKLYTWKNLDYMTSNQISWTLLALDSRDYDIPEGAVNSREQLIEWLLLFQMDDGGFALTDSSDVDMTGMIMQALAPYNNDDHPEVRAAFAKALAWLQTQITVEAGFAENASYNENSCTTAQVLTALAAAGIDPLDPANGLTVGKKNVITNLYSYKADEGFYWDPTVETKGNAMGTQQVTYALEAYRRFAAKENSLYDLTDVNPNTDQEAEAKAAFESGKPAITLKATAYNQVKVTWNSYADATGYRVYRKTAGAQWELLKETTGLSYTDKTVSGETTYYYTVKAVSTKWGGKVYSQYDKTKKVKTPVDPAKTAFQKGKPAVTVKAAAYNQVKVTWKKYTNATSYRVYRKISGGSWKLLKETTGLSYTDKTAVTGTTYYYTVKAVSTKWGGKTNSLYVTNVKVKTALSTPAISSVKNSKSKQAVVSWNKVSGASGYVVYRATSKNGTYKKVATVKSGSTVKYTNTGLKKGSTYYYKVRAYRTVSGKNVYSSYSAAKSVKITK